MMMNEPTPMAVIHGALTEHEPMAKHVTWRAGGVARYAFRPADASDLVAFFHSHRAQLDEFPPLFVGLGSNLLVRDGGIAATAIFTHPGLQSIHVVGDVGDGGYGGDAVRTGRAAQSDNAANAGDTVTIVAEVGVAAPKLARFAANHSLEGAEFLAGVPGTVGGALTMNAGCYGSQTWEHARAAAVIDRDARITSRNRDRFEIGYRHVAAQFATLGRDAWFMSATFEFTRGDGDRSRERIKELLAKRVATQPLQLPNAGSVFRNPHGDHAARLIQCCGLKGFAIGGARVSEKHANFIVNPGGAGSAYDIEALIAHVRRVVADRTGIELEPEVRIVGEVGGTTEAVST